MFVEQVVEYIFVEQVEQLIWELEEELEYMCVEQEECIVVAGVEVLK